MYSTLVHVERQLQRQQQHRGGRGHHAFPRNRDGLAEQEEPCHELLSAGSRYQAQLRHLGIEAVQLMMR